jgi:hypothetical protein
MQISLRTYALAAVAAASITAAGCGSGSSSSSSKTSGGGGAAEAKSASQGDIPDNQVFLTFPNRHAGYSIKYPEGWTQRGNGGDVTFSDKANLVHVIVASGSKPTAASANAELARQKQSEPTLKAGTAKVVRISGAPVVKVTYTMLGHPDPVTGKRPLLIIDRYELARGGKRATVDLATPKGVDNVDAYKMMIGSFKWQ